MRRSRERGAKRGLAIYSKVSLLRAQCAVQHTVETGEEKKDCRRAADDDLKG